MRAAVLLSCLVLGACLRPPLDVAGEFSASTVSDAQNAERTGERVRWGGTIAETRPRRDETCVEVVSRPLDVQARPRDSDLSFGRFLACVSGFYDPEIYARGREVTAVGIIEGTRTGQVENYDYLFPVVRAEAIHLWPERPVMRDVYYGYAPYWSPYWWGWWDPVPYWSRPPVVLRHR